MRASTAAVAKPCRRPNKASLTILVALFALGAGAQALAPSPAAAATTQGDVAGCVPAWQVPPDYDGSVPICVGSEVIDVTPGPCEDRSLCLPGMDEVPVSTGGDRSGQGSGSGPRSGTPTRVPKKVLRTLMDPRDRKRLDCLKLRAAYIYKRPLSASITPLWDKDGQIRSGEIKILYFDAHEGLMQFPTPDMAEIRRHELRLKELHGELFETPLGEGQRRDEIWAMIQSEASKYDDLIKDVYIWDQEWKDDGCVGPSAPWHEANHLDQTLREYLEDHLRKHRAP
jgi:hypothetical protein